MASEVDIRAGWRAFGAWARRFAISASGLWTRPRDKIFLCDEFEIQQLESVDAVSSESAAESISFMRAYISMMALESGHFERDVKKLLAHQGRLRAPRSFGLWFSQSDPARFGAGGSSVFQSHHARMFCGTLEQVDFADVCSILPFDNLIIRNPDGPWTADRVQSAVNSNRADLSFDGIETALDHSVLDDLLFMTLESPDYGIPLDDD